ncbi:DNAse I-like superfamily protein [Actinidia rufa]|uniref:DNAse I-like superfamily protein n=1 Tax=Actinidia rufa TaxID=165716 RepID=A0A7J0G1P9_9ERIC|nr:DNAse I-like superfamily protein [Actinidia rufa]
MINFYSSNFQKKLPISLQCSHSSAQSSSASAPGSGGPFAADPNPKSPSRSKANRGPEPTNKTPIPNGSATVHPNGAKPENPIRIATFNAAQFSMAPVVPQNQKNSPSFDGIEDFSRAKSVNDRPKSILKQSPLHLNWVNSLEILSKQQKFAKSKLRVSINLPDNEISLNRSGRLRISEDEIEASSSRIGKGKAQLRLASSNGFVDGERFGNSSRTVVEVLRELNADILGLQDVKAEEEKGMKPLSDLADALGMNYVFAESWAPEYGNAILSKWPIKKWKVQKIYDDTDFRNVLKATIDVPRVGEVNFHCTHLDHLDENWRMKQINTMIQSNEGPHILAGCLNSLDETDYSPERWTDIVKYYEQLGKPTPKVEVMKFLKSKQYADAKAFAGECEYVVMIAKGQMEEGRGGIIDLIFEKEKERFDSGGDGDVIRWRQRRKNHAGIAEVVGGGGGGEEGDELASEKVVEEEVGSEEEGVGLLGPLERCSVSLEEV